MKKDINPTPVENIGVAIVKEENELGVTIWNTYFLNLNTYQVDSVLVSSRGYSETKETSKLRYFLKDVPAKSFRLIEPIMEDVFILNNEYWISYSHNNEYLDKKYIFLQDSITEKNLTNIPLINKPGIMHL